MITPTVNVQYLFLHSICCQEKLNGLQQWDVVATVNYLYIPPISELIVASQHSFNWLLYHYELVQPQPQFSINLKSMLNPFYCAIISIILCKIHIIFCSLGSEMVMIKITA